jgi:single-strand DNA-binding protein
MAGVNKVILVGHLGKDPEVRTFENSFDPNKPNKVAKFSLATTETYKNKDGQKTDMTEWHNIVLRRGLAEVAEKYLKKGQLVYIEGKIKTRTYEKDGQTRYITEIEADNMTMLGGKKDSESSVTMKSEDTDVHVEPETPNVVDDDLPF